MSAFHKRSRRPSRRLAAWLLASFLISLSAWFALGVARVPAKLGARLLGPATQLGQSVLGPGFHIGGARLTTGRHLELSLRDVALDDAWGQPLARINRVHVRLFLSHLALGRVSGDVEVDGIAVASDKVMPAPGYTTTRLSDFVQTKINARANASLRASKMTPSLGTRVTRWLSRRVDLTQFCTLALRTFEVNHAEIHPEGLFKSPWGFIGEGARGAFALAGGQFSADDTVLTADGVRLERLALSAGFLRLTRQPEGPLEAGPLSFKQAARVEVCWRDALRIQGLDGVLTAPLARVTLKSEAAAVDASESFRIHVTAAPAPTHTWRTLLARYQVPTHAWPIALDGPVHLHLGGRLAQDKLRIAAHIETKMTLVARPQEGSHAVHLAGRGLVGATKVEVEALTFRGFGAALHASGSFETQDLTAGPSRRGRAIIDITQFPALLLEESWRPKSMHLTLGATDSPAFGGGRIALTADFKTDRWREVAGAAGRITGHLEAKACTHPYGTILPASWRLTFAGRALGVDYHGQVRHPRFRAGQWIWADGDISASAKPTLALFGQYAVPQKLRGASVGARWSAGGDPARFVPTLSAYARAGNEKASDLRSGANLELNFETPLIANEANRARLRVGGALARSLASKNLLSGTWRYRGKSAIGPASFVADSWSVDGALLVLPASLSALFPQGEALPIGWPRTVALSGRLRAAPGRVTGNLLLDVRGLFSRLAVESDARVHLGLHQDEITLSQAKITSRRAGALEAEVTGHVALRQKEVALQVAAAGDLDALGLGEAADDTGWRVDARAAGSFARTHAVIRARLGEGRVASDWVFTEQGQTVDGILEAHQELAELAALFGEAGTVEGSGRLTALVRGPVSKPSLSALVSATSLKTFGVPLGAGMASARLNATGMHDGQFFAEVPNLFDMKGTLRPLPGPEPVDVLDVTGAWRHLALAQLVPALRAGDGEILSDGRYVLRAAMQQGLRPRLTGEIFLDSLEASGMGRSLRLSHPVTLALTPSGLSLGRATLTGEGGRISMQASLVGDVLGPATELTLDSTAEASLDLAFVTDVVPLLGQGHGRLSLSGTARGPLLHARTQGRLQIDSPLTLRPRDALVELSLSKGALSITPNRLRVEHLEGAIEGGTFALDGLVLLRQLRPSHWNLKLTGQDLPLRLPDLVLEANTGLLLSGEGLYPNIQGSIEVLRGRYLRSLSLKDFQFVDARPKTGLPLNESLPFLREIGLDVHAVAKDGLDIKVDAGTFAAEATLRGDLHVTGNALRPRIAGKVDAERGRLRFPKAQLTIRQAVVDFEPAARGPLGAQMLLVAEGDVAPQGAQRSYEVGLQLSGPADKLTLDLTSPDGLGRLAVLTLLTTGHLSLDDATSSDGTRPLDAALAFAGSQMSGPLTRLAEKQLERTLRLKLELGLEVTAQQIRVSAAKSVTRRFRLEGAYSRGFASQAQAVDMHAQLSLTDKVLLEGTALQSLADTQDTQAAQSQRNIELKYRLLGR